jgi:hypothetical protein
VPERCPGSGLGVIDGETLFEGTQLTAMIVVSSRRSAGNSQRSVVRIAAKRKTFVVLE